MENISNGHILVCLSSAPSNAKIIRTAASMASAFQSQFTALFVETPDFAVATEENKARLIENQKLAASLGANIERVYGDDVPYQIAEFARLSGVTQIVLGRSMVARKYFFGKSTLSEQLINYVPEMDIHIIPDQNSVRRYRPKKAQSVVDIGKNTLKSIGILLAATLLGFGFEKLGFSESNIIMLYILGVLITSIVTSYPIYSLVSSLASVILFNYLFTTPRLSLSAYETGYPITFVIMFLTAFITGTLANRYKEQAGQFAKIAYRTKILFDTDQRLAKAQCMEEIYKAAAEQLWKLLNRKIVVYKAENGKLSEPEWYVERGEETEAYVLENERSIVEWVLKNNHAAGATKDNRFDTRYLYLAIRVNERIYGIVGIEAENNPLDASEYSMLLSILGECALALENEKNAREKEAAAILAKSEQLRANLLRTISHDLRTPLTTISGNAGNLLSDDAKFDEETKKQLYEDIYNDAQWLMNLVENLLSATRMEEGRMSLRITTELLNDIIEESISHFKRKTETHHIRYIYNDELLFVNADAKLVVQVLLNLIDNAKKYTKQGSEILIKVNKKDDFAEISVADNGCGIPDWEKTKVFEKFYCGKKKIADNRRSLGLGLYLCKAIVEAHGGEIAVADNQPTGTVFRFTLPLKEVILHE